MHTNLDFEVSEEYVGFEVANRFVDYIFAIG